MVAVAAATLAVVLQLWGLYRPTGPALATWFPGSDKVLHAVGFALPVILITLAYVLRRRALGRRPRIRVLVAVGWLFVVHAVVSELVQHAFYPNRSGDPLDVLADWSGIVVGGFVVWTAGYLRLIALRPARVRVRG
jgi:VanZ family protein